MDLDRILNEALNEAMCFKSKRIKQPNSNKIAQFVMDFMERKNFKIEDMSTKDMNVKLMCGDGFAGRNYYMTLNGVKVDICLNNGDYEKAKERTLEIFSALNIKFDEEIKFEHDGRM